MWIEFVLLIRSKSVDRIKKQWRLGWKHFCQPRTTHYFWCEFHNFFRRIESQMPYRSVDRNPTTFTLLDLNLGTTKSNIIHGKWILKLLIVFFAASFSFYRNQNAKLKWKIYLPCGSISSKVTKCILKPIVNFIQSELLIRWFDDRLSNFDDDIYSEKKTNENNKEEEI